MKLSHIMAWAARHSEGQDDALAFIDYVSKLEREQGTEWAEARSYSELYRMYKPVEQALLPMRPVRRV